MDSEIFISEYLVPDILSGTKDATEKNTDKIPGSWIFILGGKGCKEWALI